MKVSKRLEYCLKYTQGFNNLADIGTDHAKLPILAVKQGYVLKALAIDNKEGPYVIAYSNVKRYKLEDKIKVILADGISEITDETDVVVISGMGGSLIANILQKDDTRNVRRFILQPNNNPEKIREILPIIGFKVVDEIVFMDSNKLYELIVIEPGESKLNSLETIFGPVNLKQKPFYFTKRINNELEKLELVLKKLNDKEEKLSVSARITLLKEVLK